MKLDETPEGKRRAKIFEDLGFATRPVDEHGPLDLLYMLAKTNARASGLEAEEFVEDGFKLFRDAQNADDNAALDLLAKAFGQLGCAIVCMGINESRTISEQQAARMSALLKMQEAKTATIDRARAIATELWQAGDGQDARLAEMADRVYRQLVSEGLHESLPGSAERIKEWIKPVAPDHARKPGRPRNSPKRNG